MQCGADAFCGAITCPGVCVAKKNIGALAARTAECASDHVELQHCAAAPATGIPCDDSHACAPGRVCTGLGQGVCSRYHIVEQGQACDAGALCRGGGCNLGTCRPLASEGQSCRTIDCQEGLGCFGEVCRALSTCVLCSERCVDGRQCLPYLALNAICRDSIECGPERYCNSQNECAARMSAGESCAQAPCVVGLSCNQSRLCATPRLAPRGGYCENDSECASGSCYRGTAPFRCIDTVPLGARCALSENTQCTFGAYCEDASSTCRARLGGGMPCTSGTMCQSFSCDAFGACTFPRGDCTVP